MATMRHQAPAFYPPTRAAAGPAPTLRSSQAGPELRNNEAPATLVQPRVQPTARAERILDLAPVNRPGNDKGPRWFGKLPNLNWVQPSGVASLALRKRTYEDTTTTAFGEGPSYSDADVPLPVPYNANYPHPLASYASPGVNTIGAERTAWCAKLDELCRIDPEAIKGVFLARSADSPFPPSLSVIPGHGCGLPEQVYTEIEARRDADPAPGINVITTPGGRPKPDTIDKFGPLRTNFSNVRRMIVDPTSRMPGSAGKTSLCKEWSQMGRCNQQDVCPYAHGVCELRTDPARGSLNDITPLASPYRHDRRRASCAASVPSLQLPQRRSSEPHHPHAPRPAHPQLRSPLAAPPATAPCAYEYDYDMSWFNNPVEYLAQQADSDLTPRVPTFAASTHTHSVAITPDYSHSHSPATSSSYPASSYSSSTLHSSISSSSISSLATCALVSPLVSQATCSRPPLPEAWKDFSIDNDDEWRPASCKSVDRQVELTTLNVEAYVPQRSIW